MALAGGNTAHVWLLALHYTSDGALTTGRNEKLASVSARLPVAVVG